MMILPTSKDILAVAFSSERGIGKEWGFLRRQLGGEASPTGCHLITTCEGNKGATYQSFGKKEKKQRCGGCATQLLWEGRKEGALQSLTFPAQNGEEEGRHRQSSKRKREGLVK